ncbi:hypothetical protein [Stenotrophomonas sp. 24(2023)]|uniref:hypothetical protein n=1 Tax=Stenotrophomonas sp. 24(2023) TaxID=3068324 RepID=UPI0027E167C5|nr:hypothetical protein [Stenotrophomonas sp. 24(2023)]WMJ68789.1 hypothetical protein Q9R17_16630 [Stenotrophomonas sp. 24(2023)]
MLAASTTGVLMAGSTWVRGVGATLLVLELLLLAFPLTLLDGFGLLVMLQPNDHPDRLPTLLGVVLASIALLGFWRLAGGFLFNGLTLRGSPWWACLSAGLGAALCLLSLLAGALFDRLDGVSLVGMLGLPVMVPLAHMVLVTWHRPDGDRPAI